MKRYFTLIFLVSSITGLAQQKFLQPNKKWIVTEHQYVWINGNPIPYPELAYAWNYCLSTEDTIINGSSYKKLSDCDDGSYYAALREDAFKVFVVPFAENAEYLLYDFGANEGDTVKQVYYNRHGDKRLEDLRVDRVDSVEINGNFHRRLYIDAAEWIEGIGNTFGLFRETWPNVSNYSVRMNCVSNDRVIQYPEYSTDGPCASVHVGITHITPERFFISPNPAIDEISLQGIKASTLCIYDSQGRAVKTEQLDGSTTLNISDLPKGLYLVQLETSDHVVSQRLIKL